MGLCKKIYPFPIGSYYCNGQFVRYCDIADTPAYSQDELPEILTNIREKLVAGVDKRLDADTPVGFLLSGGLDSSLVCAIATKKLGKPIRTFAIGMSEDAIDLKYAKQVADYLHADHTEVIINRDIVLDALDKVVAMLGTWDITTIRASVGMYLVCKYIHEHTDIRVLLTGEISDELFGYKYTDYAPSAAAFQTESQKRIREGTVWRAMPPSCAPGSGANTAARYLYPNAIATTPKLRIAATARTKTLDVKKPGSR